MLWLFFLFFQDLKKGSKRRRNGRLGEKMQAVRRVTGVGVSPCGWNVSPGWTCHHCCCCFCRPYTLEIPFSGLLVVKAWEREREREDPPSVGGEGEASGLFFVVCSKTMTVSDNKKISVLRRDVKAFPPIGQLGVNEMNSLDSHIN